MTGRPLLRRVVSFQGRAGRAEYVAVICTALLGFVAADLGGEAPAWRALLGIALFFLMIALGFAAAARRLHDLGRSAFWMVVILLPMRLLHSWYEGMELGLGRDLVGGLTIACLGAGLIVLAVLPGQTGGNEYGEPTAARVKGVPNSGSDPSC